MLRILTERSTEYCIKVEHHDYDLSLALNDTDLDEWLVFIIRIELIRVMVCNGKTPFETLLNGKRIWAEKNLAQI